MQTSSHGLRAWWLLSLVAVLVGCGRSGPPLHPVIGKVEVRGGDASQLAGSSVEVAMALNPTTRGFGKIQPDGHFNIASLQEGVLSVGVPEGEYLVRILPNDEDGETRRAALQAMAPRYLKFETSGLSVQAPSAGEVSLTLARQ